MKVKFFLSGLIRGLVVYCVLFDWFLTLALGLSLRLKSLVDWQVNMENGAVDELLFRNDIRVGSEDSA